MVGSREKPFSCRAKVPGELGRVDRGARLTPLLRSAPPGRPGGHGTSALPETVPPGPRGGQDPDEDATAGHKTHTPQPERPPATRGSKPDPAGQGGGGIPTQVRRLK
jgi:hypothetical protein